MTKTFRRRDLKTPVRDGKCWRGCGGSYCPFCSSNRQNVKLKVKQTMKDLEGFEFD